MIGSAQGLAVFDSHLVIIISCTSCHHHVWFHGDLHKSNCTLNVTGIFVYLVLDVVEPLWEEFLCGIPLAIVDIAASPLHTFWKIPGWRCKGLSIVDIVSTQCCCACAWFNSWGRAAVTWLGPICGVAVVTSCSTVAHTCKYLQRCAMSAAGMFDKDSSIRTNAQQYLQCSASPTWNRLKGIFLRNRKDITHKASVQMDDQQPSTDAVARMPFKIKLQPVRLLRFMGQTEDEPGTVLHLAGDPQAATSAHPAAAKHKSAALQGDDVQSDLLKAHGAKSAGHVPHRAASNSPAADPDQAANGDVKLNKRSRREAKKAAKAASAADEGEADLTPVMFAAHEEDGAAVKAEVVKAAAPATPTHDELWGPISLTAQDAAAAAEGSTWEKVHRKQDRRSRRKHVTGESMHFLSAVIMHVLAAWSFTTQSSCAS